MVQGPITQGGVLSSAGENSASASEMMPKACKTSSSKKVDGAYVVLDTPIKGAIDAGRKALSSCESKAESG